MEEKLIVADSQLLVMYNHEPMMMAVYRVNMSVLCSGTVREGDGGPAAEGGGAGGQTEGCPADPAGEGRAAESSGRPSKYSSLTSPLLLAVVSCSLMFSWSPLQLARNTKSGELLKDLYVENSQLMKALEVTEHRQKNAEKKNFLLEEKINALNKLLREIVPASLAT